MASSLPPVSPGSLMTESPGDGSAAFIIKDALGEQMDADEHQQADATAASPAGLEGGQGGDDDDEDDGNVQVPPPVNTFGPSPYTAHQDFLRSASHFVSPTGYDVHTPSDWPGNAPVETPIWNPYAALETPNGYQSSAPDYSGESVMDAFNRHSAMAVSSMGYDTGLPNGAPGHVYPQGAIPPGTPEAVEMNDSTKRGRADPPSPAASSVRPPPKRSAAPAPTGSGRLRRSRLRPRLLRRTRRGY